MNSIPLGKLGPLSLVCFRGRFPLNDCFLSFPLHTDVSNSRSYCDVNRCDADASLFDRLRSLRVFIPPLLRSVLTLTAVDVAGLWIPIRLGGNRQRIQIQTGNSQRHFRPTGWRWPCTRLPGTFRQPRRTNTHCVARIVHTSSHRTSLSC